MGLDIQNRSDGAVEGVLSARAEGVAPLCAVPDVPEETIRALVEDMNRTGVAMLPNYVQPEDLKGLQTFVETSVANAGGQYVVFNGKDEVSGTFLACLTESEQFQSLIRRVYELGTNKKAPPQALYQVLRCLKGSSGLRQAMIFHFDSYVVTALLPILIPSKGKTGDLVMAPNLRKERPFYWRNLIDKILLDNKFTQAVLRYGFETQKFKMKKIKMIPGNLYFFWGYRTLHTNESCDIENIRSTALYHFCDPHADSALRQKMGRTTG